MAGGKIPGPHGIFPLTGKGKFFRGINFQGSLVTRPGIHLSGALHFGIRAGGKKGPQARTDIVKKYTQTAKNADNPQNWYVVDAEGMVLGRLATEVASRLRGKRNPMFTPHADAGDWVIVVNADKVVLTGRKLDQKMYYRHSGYMGGLKSITARKLMEKRPEDLIRFAVRGMLPKNRLGRKLNKKLKVYAGPDHPHEAQKPEPMTIQS